MSSTFFILYEKEPDTISNKAVFGNRVHFDFKDKKLVAHFSLGVISPKYSVMPFFIGDVISDVNYDGEKFTLNNLYFEYVK